MMTLFRKSFIKHPTEKWENYLALTKNIVWAVTKKDANSVQEAREDKQFLLGGFCLVDQLTEGDQLTEEDQLTGMNLSTEGDQLNGGTSWIGDQLNGETSWLRGASWLGGLVDWGTS